MDTYKEKYNEALAKARHYYLTGEGEPVDFIKMIFPEFAESEDERIRKGLVRAVSETLEGNKLFDTDVTREEALAWLEKQGEHKPTDEEMKELFRTEYEKGRADTIAEMQKFTWSEEDNKWIESLIQTFEDGYLEGFNQLKSYGVISWLKSIKERVQPQPKQEWSEEDEKRFKSCLNILQAKGLIGVTDTINSNWLKSLKDRCTWKPNEWQLKAIKWIMDGDNPENWTVTLANLYNDLKKL